MDFTAFSDSLNKALITPQQHHARTGGKASRKSTFSELVYRVKNESLTEVSLFDIPSAPELEASHTEAAPPTNEEFVEPDDEVEVVEENLDAKVLLARLVKPAQRCDSFTIRAKPPFEPTPDKEFCLHLPYSWEYLNPIFACPRMDPAKLFTVLSGHKVPDSKHPDFDHQWWEFSWSNPALLPYVAFSRDYASNDFTGRSVHGLSDGQKWLRLEFGREAYNYGQNYDKEKYDAALNSRAARRAAEALDDDDDDDAMNLM